MNKFITAIAGNAEGIKRKRAEDAAKAAQLAQENLINKLKGDVQAVEASLTRVLDIGPETSDSLRPVGANFNATAWVREVQDLRVAHKDVSDKLAIAEATYAEWFSDRAVPATA